MGKRYATALAEIDQEREYPLEEAITLLKKGKPAKFDETVEMAIRLGVDPKHAEQMVRGAVVLPHGIGKSIRVLVFAKGEKEREAREEFIDNQTFLGHLRHSLIVLGAMQHDKVPMTRELLPKPSDVGLDARQYAYEEFAQLLLELDGAKSKPLLDALQGVLSSVRTDILFQSEDMPPVPQLPELV